MLESAFQKLVTPLRERLTAKKSQREVFEYKTKRGQILEASISLGKEVPLEGEKEPVKTLDEYLVTRHLADGKTKPFDVLKFIEAKLGRKIPIYCASEGKKDNHYWHSVFQYKNGVPEEERIFIQKPKEISTLVTLLHEAGHAKQHEDPRFEVYTRWAGNIMAMRTREKIPEGFLKGIAGVYDTILDAPPELDPRLVSQEMLELYNQELLLKTKIEEIQRSIAEREIESLDELGSDVRAIEVAQNKWNALKEEREKLRQALNIKLEGLHTLLKQMTERSADAYTLTWVRELEKKVGIDLFQQYQQNIHNTFYERDVPEVMKNLKMHKLILPGGDRAMVSPIGVKRWNLSSYGGMLRQMKSQYSGKLPRPHPDKAKFEALSIIKNSKEKKTQL